MTSTKPGGFALVVSMFGVLCIAAACAAEKPEPPALSQRQRDSIIGASALPGAAGVRGALSAQDSAARRQARLDSIARADSL
jgi:hypothetical protein